MGDNVQTIFRKLNLTECVLFGLPLGDGSRLAGFCDYVYTPPPERSNMGSLARLIYVFLQQIHLAIQHSDFRRHQDRVREEAWREFHTTTAHRIGTEVADISGALRKLRFPAIAKDDGVRDAYKRIQSSLERMRAVVTDYSRVAIERPLRLKLVNLIELLHSVEQESVFPERGQAKVVIDTHASPPPTYADAEMLSYAFSELLHNAFKALQGKENGRIYIWVNYDESEERVLIRFTDNGSGIPQDAQPRVFERGFSLRPGGTGQGLYIVRRYIQNHRGYIELEASSRGCSFVVCLPVAREVPHGGVRVLIVDDNANLANDIREAVLDEFPAMEVQVATGRQEALRLIGRTEWHMAVFDIILGADNDRSGIDLLRTVRDKGLPTKVIMVTAHRGLPVTDGVGVARPAEDVCRSMGAVAFIYRNEPGTDYIDEIVERVHMAIKA